MTQYEHHDGGERDEYATKPELWRPLADALGGFDVDPASGAETAPIANTTYTEADDGLAQEWHGDVWLNPPFSDKGAWLRKAVNEVNAGNAQTVVSLVPVDTSTQWFQQWFSHAQVVCWLEGRDWYVANGSPSFNTAVGVFGECPAGVRSVLQSKGVVSEFVREHTQATL